MQLHTYGFLPSLWLFLAALLLALLEIEIEGGIGWAERLPTWQRAVASFPLPLRLVLYTLFGKKPVTGYHLCLVSFTAVLIHGAYFIGLDWSLGSELGLLSRLILFWLLEDFLWFVMNPKYGLAEFRPGRVWWHDLDEWAFKLVPRAFVVGLGASCGLAIVSGSLGDFTLGAWIQSVLYLSAMLCLSVRLSKRYHAWHAKMRE